MEIACAKKRPFAAAGHVKAAGRQAGPCEDAASSKPVAAEGEVEGVVETGADAASAAFVGGRAGVACTASA